MEAYIIKARRTATGKAPRGMFRDLRTDDLAAQAIQQLLNNIPAELQSRIDDVIVGNAFPESEQGLNMGRMISLIGLNRFDVPGMTVNRYCASGLESITIAVAKIQAGLASCILAGGAESMSVIPFGGWRSVPNPKVAADKPNYYWGMGLTAEAVAAKYNVSREDQDTFSYHSHMKALKALAQGFFKEEIAPVDIEEVFLDVQEKKQTRKMTIDTDEGPRADTSIDKLARLKPVFDAFGSVTAGNSSQTSDGAAFLLVVSETLVKELNLKPIARLVSYAVAGVEPHLMGIGPIEAIPKALKKAGLKLSDIEQIELNEAFASQSLAVIREVGLDPDKVNVNGGAIALGHPLGATGSKLTVQLLHDMRRKKQRYGMVTMCVGSGQGAAGIFELL